MSPTIALSPDVVHVPVRYLFVLACLFVGSGCTALIYEIVWFQLLQFVIGSSAVSLAVLLGAFMGGMCLGSLFGPRWVPVRAHPLRAYAWLELGIGVSGILVLIGMPFVGSLYASFAGRGFLSLALRAMVAGVCLVPPTLLMGATLPVIARSVDTTPRGVTWLGWFYAGNLAGAVCGCLLAGFYLLRIYDVGIATYFAAATNLAVALAAWILAFRLKNGGSGACRMRVSDELADIREPVAAIQQPEIAETADVRQRADAIAIPGTWRVYVAIGLSGLCALGAEVVWTRLLSLMLGGTVYTFSLILAVFLIGLGLGSAIGARLRHSGADAGIGLGICQLLLVGAIGWGAWQLMGSLPFWPIHATLSRSPWITLQLDLVRCLWAVLPAACLWGASFPLALAAVASPTQDFGVVVGRVYAANTAGAIVGAVAFGTILIGAIGTQRSQQLLMLLTAVSGLAMLVPAIWQRTSLSPFSDPSTEAPLLAGSVLKPGLDNSGVQKFSADCPRPETVSLIFRRLTCLFAVICATGLALILIRSIPPVPAALVACGRNLPTDGQSDVVLFQGEGLNSSVAVSLLLDGTRSYTVSGRVEASSAPSDMRMQKMLGHIPALLHPKPRSALVVGCGAGVTAGSLTTHPDIERIVICEIEPLVPRYIATYFRDENYDVVNDPRVHVEYDDARHFIRTTRENFDIITSDPIHPWVKGSATLYTTEYFELCKKHLNPGGVITQWVPLYESSTDVIKSELATLFKVFPEASIWGNETPSGKGYDLVVLAQQEPLRVDVDQTIARLARADHRRVALSLATVGFQSAVDLLARFGGQAADLASWLKGAQLNRDGNLRLQYLAGWGQNVHRQESLYDEIVAHRQFSDTVFVGSELRREELRLRMRSGGRPQRQ